MSTVRRNIVSNLVAGVWTTVLTLVITPLQVKVLGIEAYGLIGFIATLQIVFAVFDLGLSSTLTRAVASDHSPSHRDSRDLVKTAATVYWTFSLLIGSVLAAGAGTIATHWFSSSHLKPADVEGALYAMTLFLAARWPVALYGGVLSGLQRLDVLNIVKMATTTLRLLGGIGVLLLSPSLHVFLWWSAANAIVEVIAYMVACQRFSGIPALRFGISAAAIRSVWSFSVSLSALSILGLVISQLDRLMLSKLLSLSDLGFYMLAYNTAATVSLAISSISSAMLPAFAAAHSQGAQQALVARYGSANKVMLFVVGAAVFPLIFFGDVILTAWVGAGAAAGASGALALLAIGFWFSAALSNAYSVAVACGRPGLVLKLSAASALPYAALLYGSVRLWGIQGAAAAWMLLNLIYLFILVPVVHARLIGASSRHWLAGTVMPFLLLGGVCFGVMRFVASRLISTPSATDQLAALALGLTFYAVGGFVALGGEVHHSVATALRRLTPRALPVRR